MVPTAKRKKRKDSDEMITPEWVWKIWHDRLNFVLDAAATKRNKIAPAKLWYTKEDDALKQCWTAAAIEGGGAVWCNPPYSPQAGPLKRWVEKGIAEAQLGAVVCMLLPADTSTQWFSLLYDRVGGGWRDGVHGYFTDHRIRFVDPVTRKPTPGSPNFGSLIVVLSAESDPGGGPL